MAERMDPTSAGFTPPKTGKARLSAGEVDALCLKAARGAGMDWGLAEEAGFAARWLFARGIDGPSALLSHLDGARDRAWEHLRPAGIGAYRVPKGGPLCPIALGAALSDCCALPGEAVGPVSAPVLLLPFLGLLAETQGRAVTATWDGGAVAVGPGGALSGDVSALAAAKDAVLRIAAVTSPATRARADAQPPMLNAETLAQLDSYALQTTVPATRASRADAGSAAGDND